MVLTHQPLWCWFYLPPTLFWSWNSEAGSMISNWMGVPGTIRSSASGALLEDCTPPGLALRRGRERRRVSDKEIQKTSDEDTISIPEITHDNTLFSRKTKAFPLHERLTYLGWASPPLSSQSW